VRSARGFSLVENDQVAFASRIIKGQDQDCIDYQLSTTPERNYRMRTRYLILGLTLCMLTGLVSHAAAETRHFKCTIAGTFTDVETYIDTNGDNRSATLDQGVFTCNGSNGIFQEEVEWIPQSAVTTCPAEPGMREFHVSPTQGQHRSVSTDAKTGDQSFSQITSGTLCFNTFTGQTSVTSEGVYIGGTGKAAGATGTFTSQTSGSYLMFGFKGGVFGGFGQFTGTVDSTLILPDGNGN
jgi:hypothetical protein